MRVFSLWRRIVTVWTFRDGIGLVSDRVEPSQNRFGLNPSEISVGWIRFGSCFTSKCNGSVLASKKIISRRLAFCPTPPADVTRWWSDLIVSSFDQNEKKNTRIDSIGKALLRWISFCWPIRCSLLFYCLSFNFTGKGDFQIKKFLLVIWAIMKNIALVLLDRLDPLSSA